MNELRLEVVFTNALQIATTAPTELETGSFVITHNNFVVIAEGYHVMYLLPVDFVVTMKVNYFDAAGNPAKIDGDVIWSCSDDDLAAIDVDSGDSSIVTVSSLAQLGQVQIVATADADLGAGMRQLKSVADIEIVAGEAVTGTISPVGEPQPSTPHVEAHKK